MTFPESYQSVSDGALGKNETTYPKGRGTCQSVNKGEDQTDRGKERKLDYQHTTTTVSISVKGTDSVTRSI